MLKEEEIKRLGERALAGGGEEVVLDGVGVGVSAPDDAEGGEDVDVDVGEGAEGAGEFGDGGGGDVGYAWGGVREPGVG